jgi:ribosomal protein L37AE/L43A
MCKGSDLRNYSYRQETAWAGRELKTRSMYRCTAGYCQNCKVPHDNPSVIRKTTGIWECARNGEYERGTRATTIDIHWELEKVKKDDKDRDVIRIILGRRVEEDTWAEIYVWAVYDDHETGGAEQQ